MSETAPAIEIEPTQEEPFVAGDVTKESAPAGGFAAELAELKDRHLRLQADFENFRKRKIKEAEEIRQFASVSVLENILPALDHFALALDSSHDRTDPKWGQGIDLISRQLNESLKLFGLEEFAVSRGDKFEISLHEAVAEEETNEVKPGHVTRTIRKGYKVRERVIRHAHVMVAREPAILIASGDGVKPDHDSDSSEE